MRKRCFIPVFLTDNATKLSETLILNVRAPGLKIIKELPLSHLPEREPLKQVIWVIDFQQ